MGKAKQPATKPPLGVVELTVRGCRCRCGHLWIPREWLKAMNEAGGSQVSSDSLERPRVCPECKSPNWDREKLFTRNGNEK